MTENTLCIRCGKERIVKKTWTEGSGSSEVTYTQTVCPDPQCQKIVEFDLASKREKIKEIQKKSQQRRQLNIRNKKSKNS